MSQIRTAGKDKLLDEFNAVVAETENLLKSAASLGTEQAGVLKGNLNDALSSASERVADIRDRSIERASAAAKAAEAYVQENPWRAVGYVALIAGLAGLVSGLVIARR
jgi:ElaB/YqjD/DUF883 family membrane-anchored ribosome-binding protein